VTEPVAVCTQKQQKSCLAPIIRQRASSSTSITHSIEECSSPFVKQIESVPDFDVQSARLNNTQQKSNEATSLPKIEKDENDNNSSPQPLKKSSIILKKSSVAPLPIQNLHQQQQLNKPLTIIPKLV